MGTVPSTALLKRMEDEEYSCVHSCSMSASGWAEGQPEAQVTHCPGQSAKGENCRGSNL